MIRKEISKISSNAKNKKEFFDYCINEKKLSYDNALKYFDMLVDSPELIPQEELAEIFSKFNLKIKEDNNCFAFAKKINDIIISIINLNKELNNPELDDIIIKLLEIKNKEGKNKNEF